MKNHKKTEITLELKKKIILRDPDITLEEMVSIMRYFGKTDEEIAKILVWNVSFEQLKEDYEKVGPLLKMTFEDYRSIWRGYKRK